MASLALQLKSHDHKTLQTLLKPTPNLTLFHLFSSSSSSDNNGGNTPKPTDFNSYFRDIKSRLRHAEQQHQRKSTGFKLSFLNRSKAVEGEEIMGNLSEFRRRSAVSPESPQPADSQQPTAVVDLYNRANPNPNPNPVGENGWKGSISFDRIRERLRQQRGSIVQKDKDANDRFSLNKYKENFRASPPTPLAGGGKVYGGSADSLPVLAFGKELRDREKRGEMGKDGGEEDMANSKLTRYYTFDELGKRLKDLRPELADKAKEEGGEENWFSLAELNERLKKLRDIEEEESRSNGKGFLRDSIRQMKLVHDQQAQMTTAQRLSILGRIHSNKDLPPKEHLIEKYFHPDNMSSAEKLKVNLKEVRDEFKMHESDCGSARVQIAQLTTEIIHLSSVLHKKDKHSRRGLLAKVQQRKKLLKYLRKTDWDSYCFVLSKFGLRDNPDYKN